MEMLYNYPEILTCVICFLQGFRKKQDPQYARSFTDFPGLETLKKSGVLQHTRSTLDSNIELYLGETLHKGSSMSETV
jgi:hypothetical protein